jgi:hypothetical protein
MKKNISKGNLLAFSLIGVLLLLMYGKNHLERQAFRNISSAFTEVYNDRLIVEGYIFQISENLFQIQKLIDHCTIGYDYSKAVDEITTHERSILGIVEEFEKTNLTVEEANYLSDFKNIIENDLSIKSYDSLFSDVSGVNLSQVKLYDGKISRARQDLQDLSKIQMDEGGKLISKAKTLINRSQLWAQFEVALLIILVISIFLLLFRKIDHNLDVN